MLRSLRSVKKLIRSWFTPLKQETVQGRSRRVRLRLERLEERLAPATISDAGAGQLSIVLGTGENLAVVSGGTTCTFTSNQNFTAASATNPANQATAFAGVGTQTLTLTHVGLTRYNTIAVTDAGANDAVTFNDSGTNAYTTAFAVTLSDPGAGNIQFVGNSAFGPSDLAASTTHEIIDFGTITAGSGNITFSANMQRVLTVGTFGGIYIPGSIRETASGAIAILGRAATLGQAGIIISGTVAGGSGGVKVFGSGGAAVQGADWGVGIGAAGSVTSIGGGINITGSAGGSGSDSGMIGVEMAGQVSAEAAGNIIINGAGGATTGSSDAGVEVAGTVKSSGGNISISGGSGGPNQSNTATGENGVQIDAAGSVTGGGNALVGLQGTDTSTGAGNGVVIDGVVSSAGGNVQVTGQVNPGLSNTSGVLIKGVVSAANTGTVTVTGVPTGGGGALAPAVDLQSSGAIQSSSGALTVNAQGQLSLAGTVSTTSGTTLTLTADHINFVGQPVVSAGPNTVNLLPFNPFTLIDLGNPNAAGLGLDSAALNRITAGTLQIGGPASGTITVSKPVALSRRANVNLITGGDIKFNAGSLNTDGGALSLTPANGHFVLPLTNGTDAFLATSALSFGPGATVSLELDGTVAGTDYNQLSVVGDVNLTGASLFLSGNSDVLAGQTFTIVDNRGSHQIVGTFSGLPEGTVIPNFLGSPFNARISYVGGTGNDVVLTVLQAVSMQISASAGAATYGTPVTFTATVTAASGTPSGSVEFFDDTTGADLGAGIPESHSANNAIWVYATKPAQLQVAASANAIRAVFNPTGSFAASSRLLLGGETITPFPLTISGLTANNKVYDGSNLVTIDTANVVLTGAFAGDAVTVSKAAGLFASVDVRTQIPVTATVILGGAQAADYTPVLTEQLTANITPATLGVTGVTARDKVYDATTTATVSATNLMLVGVLAGDGVTVSAGALTGHFDSKDVGTNIPVTLGGITIGGPKAGDYTLRATTTANITPFVLIGTGGTLTANNKVYDSTLAATAQAVGVGLAGVLPGDAVTVTGATGTFASKDVGQSVPVTLMRLTLGGDQASDYTAFLSPSRRSTANITPAPLTVAGVTADKVYDHTTAATLNTAGAALVGLFSGDTVTLMTGAATGTFASKDVGSGLSVTVSGLALGGARAGDYQLTQPALTASITPAPLSVTGIKVSDKVYDATVTAALNATGASLLGVLGGDAVTLDASAATAMFSSANVGSNVAVTVASLALDGAQAGDYLLTAPALAAKITAAPLTVVGLTANNKVYDAGTAATLDLSHVSLVDVIDADKVTLAGATGAFATKDVGTGIAVAVTGLTLGGAQAADYAPVLSAALTANITPAPLTGTVTKVYDATTLAALASTGMVLAGVFPGDMVTVNTSGVTGTFASKDVGTNIVMTLPALTLAGAQKSDYALTTVQGTITPALLTVGGALISDKVYDGTTAATVNGTGATLAGGFSGDTVRLVTAGAVAAFASKDVADGISVYTLGLALAGAQASDYALAPVTTQANITPAPLTVTGILANKVYDRTTAATLNTAGAALVGLFGSDVVTLVSTGASATFATSDAANGISLTVTGLALSGPQAGDYVLTRPVLTANIVPAPLTVSGITASSKVYDGTAMATLNTTGAVLSGVLSGDTVNLDASAAVGTFASKDAANNVTVAISGLTLGGPQATDYTILQSTPGAALTSWGQFQGNAAHSGAIAAIVDPNSLTPAWTVSTATLGAASFIPGIVGDDSKVYFTANMGPAPNESYEAIFRLYGLDGATGTPVWSDTHTPNAIAASAPSTLGSTVYVQFAGYADPNTDPNDNPLMVGIDSTTGQTIFANHYLAQSGYANQPTVLGNAVFAHAGYYGGFRAYDATTGATVWENTSPALEEQPIFVPAADGNRLYVYMGGTGGVPGPEVSTLFALNEKTGAIDFTIENPLNAGGFPNDAKNVILGDQGDLLVAARDNQTGDVLSFDLAQKKLRWRVNVDPSGPMAVADGKVYVPSGDRIYILDEATGTTIGQMVVGNGQTLSNNVLVTGNLAFTSSATGTFAFDRSTLQMVWSTNVGGSLAWAQHELIISSATAIHAFAGVLEQATTANITPAPVTVSGITVNNKVYDGTTTASLNTASAALVGVVPGDAVAITEAAGSFAGAFASKNVGNGITVTVSGLTLAGPNARDYSLTMPVGSASITARPLMVTATGHDKAYDGTTAATVTFSDNRVADDVLTDSFASAAFASAGPGSNIPITVTGISISGADAGNYTLANTTATTMANILVLVPLPKVTVNSLNSLEGTSGLTAFVFSIRLLAPAPRAVTYDVYTTDGTAKAGVNYIGITAGDSAHGGAVTVAAGSAFATVTVYVIAGSLPVTPATERAFFTVSLSDPLLPDVPLATGTGTITAQTAIPEVAAPAVRSRMVSVPWNRVVAKFGIKKIHDDDVA